MDIEHTAESQQTDELLDDSLSQATTGSSKRQAAFMQQLADFEATAESHSNPLGGALAYVLSETMSMSIIISDAIKHALPDTPTLDDLERVKGPLNDFFKAARQADRFANFELRMEEVRLRSRDARHTNRSGGRLQGGEHGGRRHRRGPSQFHD